MFCQLVAVFLLAVQDTQGVALQAILAGGAKLLVVGSIVVLQRLLELGAAVGTADGVDEETDLLHTQGVQRLLHQADDLSIGSRALGAQQLHAELVEFPVASGLGLLVPEAGGDVAELQRQGFCHQAPLQSGAYCTGGSLRLQGDGTPLLILKGVHFLLDHIGGIAHRTDKQFGVLEGGGADLAKAVQTGDAHQCIFNIPHPGALLGGKILCSPGRLGNQCHSNPDFPSSWFYS